MDDFSFTGVASEAIGCTPDHNEVIYINEDIYINVKSLYLKNKVRYTWESSKGQFLQFQKYFQARKFLLNLCFTLYAI